MPQESGQSRPLHLSESQINDLAAGKGSFGEHSRPRAVTEEHVAALRKGEALKIEEIPVLKEVTHARADVTAELAGSRPKALTEREVKALSQGTDVGLEKRSALEAQRSTG